MGLEGNERIRPLTLRLRVSQSLAAKALSSHAVILYWLTGWAGRCQDLRAPRTDRELNFLIHPVENRGTQRAGHNSGRACSRRTSPRRLRGRRGGEAEPPHFTLAPSLISQASTAVAGHPASVGVVLPWPILGDDARLREEASRLDLFSLAASSSSSQQTANDEPFVSIPLEVSRKICPQDPCL